MDSRNFHGWAYWRWLAARMQLSSAASLEYTEQHLRDNFSNYSAWHARTSLLVAAAQAPRVPTLAELLAHDVGMKPPSAHRLDGNPGSTFGGGQEGSHLAASGVYETETESL